MQGYNFTERTRKVLALAREEASGLSHEYVGSEHILLGILNEGEGVAATVLQNLGVEADDLRYRIEQVVKRGDPKRRTGPDLPYTSRAKKVLELSMSHARDLNHSYVGTEHLLLGLLAEQKGIAAQVLVDNGVTLDNAVAETLRILGTEMPRETPATQRRRAAERDELGARTRPRSTALVQVLHDTGLVASEFRSTKATPLHAAIALLRRGEGFAIAILDRLELDASRALAELESAARSRDQGATPEEAPTFDPELAEFRREMNRTWTVPMGSLDLLLFLLDKDADVARVFAGQSVNAERLIDEGERFSG